MRGPPHQLYRFFGDFPAHHGFFHLKCKQTHDTRRVSSQEQSMLMRTEIDGSDTDDSRYIAFSHPIHARITWISKSRFVENGVSICSDYKSIDIVGIEGAIKNQKIRRSFLSADGKEFMLPTQGYVSRPPLTGRVNSI